MAIILRFLGVAIQILAGVGIAELMDKILPGKAPNYEPVSPGIRPAKLIYFLVAFAAGSIIWKFIQRKFHISFSRSRSQSRRKRR